MSDYFGGATDAETRMRQRLDALVAKGAPIVVGVISDQNREWNVHNRTAVEKRWAKDIESQVMASGATRALLLVSHTDARDAAYPRSERFAGYDPMPTHLPKGEVISLEIGSAPTAGITSPAVRLYPKPVDGFYGQVALASLTRPMIALAVPIARPDVEPRSASLYRNYDAVFDALRPDMTRAEKLATAIRLIEADFRKYPSRNPQSQPPASLLAENLVGAYERREAQKNAVSTDIQLDIPSPQVDLPDFELEKAKPN